MMHGCRVLLVVLLSSAAVSPLAATQRAAASASPAGAAPPLIVAGVTPPADYVIGPEDVLVVQFWRDAEISGETVVRPDGKITLKLLNDIPAAGLTPDQLREVLLKAASKFLEDPAVTVTVKQIKSRFVTVMGEVGKQGPVPLNGPMRVMDALGMAGGVSIYAQKNKIAVLRNDKGGVQTRIPFDYKKITEGKKLEQNIYLMPGDTVLVP
jgi:polysaccharide export outer membrane protein